MCNSLSFQALFSRQTEGSTKAYEKCSHKNYLYQFTSCSNNIIRIQKKRREKKETKITTKTRIIVHVIGWQSMKHITRQKNIMVHRIKWNISQMSCQSALCIPHTIFSMLCTSQYCDEVSTIFSFSSFIRSFFHGMSISRIQKYQNQTNAFLYWKSS